MPAPKQDSLICAYILGGQGGGRHSRPHCLRSRQTTALRN